jgi:hypothetical protein
VLRRAINSRREFNELRLPVYRRSFPIPYAGAVCVVTAATHEDARRRRTQDSLPPGSAITTQADLALAAVGSIGSQRLETASGWSLPITERGRSTTLFHDGARADAQSVDDVNAPADP